MSVKKIIYVALRCFSSQMIAAFSRKRGFPQGGFGLVYGYFYHRVQFSVEKILLRFLSIKKYLLSGLISKILIIFLGKLTKLMFSLTEN